VKHLFKKNAKTHDSIQLKLFFKIFFILLIFEFLLGLCNAYFSSENITFLGVRLGFVTSTLIQIFSMPISIFGRDLPFYHHETWVAIVLTILNIAIQSFIIMQLLKTFKGSKSKTTLD